MKITAIACFCLVSTWGYAQILANQWHHKDPMTDNVVGISANRAYELLDATPAQLKSNFKPIIVAVIDGGMDLYHEDLKAVLWTNPNEIDGNGKDDDHNGYIDDVHGWNFLGLADGHTRVYDQREETRLYSRLNVRYKGKTEQSLSAAEQPEFDLYQQVKAYYERNQTAAWKSYFKDSLLLAADRLQIPALKKAFGVSRIDSALLHNPPTTDSTLLRHARNYYRDMKAQKQADLDSLLLNYEQANTDLKNPIVFDYNLTYKPPLALGEKPNDLTQRYYGNADASGDYTKATAHGTHVGGIIAADRTNSVGGKGIADRVRLMSVVVVSGGDERDKDIANAIRYAVDNGASIINLSLGKYFSSDRILVDQAIRYADRKGALLVCAAGNDHLDLDSAWTYPAPTYLDGTVIPNLITVGSSNQTNDSTLVASSSNYGHQHVDVFAPGVQIWSCVSGNTYRPLSGASMASPMVAGVAAVLKTYFPSLTPSDLKRIILQSAVPYHTLVVKPGTRQKVDFAVLSKTGGIVNLYQAVKVAMAEQSTKR